MGVFAYILLRLAILVRREGVSGVSDWAGETKRHITGRFNVGQSHNGFGQPPSDTRSDSTSDTGVILQDTDIRAPSIRDDGFNSDYNAKVQG
jgi:hypothetical protein